jgi:hypothetical protein
MPGTAPRFIPLKRAAAYPTTTGIRQLAQVLTEPSGQGIIKALRPGIFAAYAIGDFLRNVRGLRHYRLMLNREFVAYQEALRGYYSQERRWPNRLFWRRRIATAATSCDKTLEQKGLSTAREP